MYTPITCFTHAALPEQAGPDSGMIAGLLADALAAHPTQAAPHRFDALPIAAVRRQVGAASRGHPRQEFDDCVALDAGAILAQGRPNSADQFRIALGQDPFGRSAAMADSLNLPEDEVLLRLMDGLMGAGTVLALGPLAQRALAFLPIPLDCRPLPACRGFRPISADRPTVAVLSASLLPDLADQPGLHVVDATGPAQDLAAGPGCDVVVLLGPADTLPFGRRIEDAWLSGVPVIQCRRPHSQSRPALPGQWIEDGVTGLACDHPADLPPLIHSLWRDRAMRTSLTRRAASVLTKQADWLALATELCMRPGRQA